MKKVITGLLFDRVYDTEEAELVVEDLDLQLRIYLSPKGKGFTTRVRCNPYGEYIEVELNCKDKLEARLLLSNFPEVYSKYFKRRLRKG